MPSEKKNPHNSFVRYSGLAFQMAATIGLATWFGIWLDSKIALKFPLFTISLSMLFTLASIIWLVRSLRDDE